MILIMKKILKVLLGIIVHFQLWIFAHLDRKGTFLMTIICSYYERYSNNFIQFKLRPKKADSIIGTKIKTTTTPGEFAIVLQGPVEVRDDFTFETVRFYKQMFPKAHIILSTWDNTEQLLVERFRAEGCHVVLNSVFRPCGISNVNYQICTSLAGIRKAKELGAVYTLKNRSDLRLYREFVLEYLKSLMNLFPVPIDNSLNLRGRILTQSGNWGQMFMPLWLQDFLYFGYTDDLLDLFNIEYSDSTISSSQVFFKKMSCERDVMGDFMFNIGVPELYITRTFVKKHISEDIDVKRYWEMVKDYFIMLDSEQLGSFWYKARHLELSNFCCEYDGVSYFTDSQRHISFEDFINIHNDIYKYEVWMEKERNNYVVFRNKSKK